MLSVKSQISSDDDVRSPFEFELHPVYNEDGTLPPMADIRFEVHVTPNRKVLIALGSEWQGESTVVLDGLSVCRGTYEGLEFPDDGTRRRFELEVGTAVAEANSFPGVFLP